MGTISVSQLGKAYKKYPNRWARLAEWFLPWASPRHSLQWVLQEISFSVQAGEAVGVIGINGAGKSTLLKMIAGTTQPTIGHVDIHGRVAALLELGMGFHPDFTGRQNAWMAGQLLGYSAEEMAGLMPAIEDFAEIHAYIDQPVRVYSSGMQMRLAFSVATAQRPDVLIVDEALSVGDAYFQHKCFQRIRDFRRQGTTLLLVSHDKQAIQNLCDRAILISAGRVAMQGDPETVMDCYNAMLADHQNQAMQLVPVVGGKLQTISGSGEVLIEEVHLLNSAGEPVEVINVGQSIRLRVRVRAVQAVHELIVGYVIKDRLGQAVFGTNTHHLHESVADMQPHQTLTFFFDFQANLGEGHYSIAVALHTADNHLTKNYEWRDLALLFNVVNMDKPTFVGLAWLPPRLERTE